ncbi:MAG: hypothetical protein NT069_01360 [Planctomycetota bacterium]|nr:hypothetical protein [Planctomycetota bacterium]
MSLPESEAAPPSVVQQQTEDMSELPPPKVVRRVEEFIQMAQFSHGQGRDPFVEKMTAEHVTAVIYNKDKDNERKHAEENQRILNQRWYLVGTGVFILAICALFLGFQQTDHLDAVLAAVSGLIGGIGIGRASSNEKSGK